MLPDPQTEAPVAGPREAQVQRPARGTVAALQRPLALAEAAAAAHDYGQVVQLLRQPMHDFGARLGNGRLFELWGACGVQGQGRIAPEPALRQALHAYQDEHDVAGLARCHAALGELALGRGEMEAAEREYGYAHELYNRRGSVQERVGSLARQAQVAGYRTDVARAVALSEQGVALCRSLRAPACAEAQARLVRAQSLAQAGERANSVRDLLWAEKLLAAAGDGAGMRDEVVFLRAETLLALGFPRRSLTVLRPTLAAAGAPYAAKPTARAHALRLQGEATLADEPSQAGALLHEAQRRFAVLAQPYFRLRCEIGLLRAWGRSQGRTPHLAQLQQQLATARLQRWPQLERMFDAAKEALQRPEVHVPGAVRTPWVKELGHYTGRVATDVQTQEQAAQPADEAGSWRARAQAIWGRMRGSARA